MSKKKSKSKDVIGEALLKEGQPARGTHGPTGPQESANKKQSPPAVESTDRSDPVALALGVRWSFPTRSKCPRCGGFYTRATSTQGNVQYRKCMIPICQKRYSVLGKKI